jgi:hypothetical protein
LFFVITDTPRTLARGPPRRTRVVEIDSNPDEMVLTFASDEDLEAGGPQR